MRIRRSLLLILLAVLLAAAAWFGFQAYTVVHGITTITGVSVPRIHGEPTIKIPPLNGNKRYNILILGSDNDRKLQEARPLAQSMIIVTVDPVNRKVGMLSIPRDFYVQIPGHGRAKIDLAFKYGQAHHGIVGGMQLARLTVEKLFHIPIDYTAWVGLEGFIKVVDTFGGVTVDVSYPVLDDSYPNDLNAADPYGYERLFIPPGWQHMLGDQALEYVRSRHGDLIGDFGRSDRQQQVLIALQQKANALNVVAHLPSLIADLHGTVVTELNPIELYQLSQLSRQIQPRDVTHLVLQAPKYSRNAFTPDGQYILVPTWSKIRPAVTKMFSPIHVRAKPAREETHRQAAHPQHSATPRTTTHPRTRPKPHLAAGPTPGSVVGTASRLPGKLLYVVDGNIVMVSRDGSTRQLTHAGTATQPYAMPSLSPNGKQLAYIRFSANYSDLWVMNLATGKQRRLTHDLNPLGIANPDVRNNLWAAWPAWQNGGKSIVFSWDRAKLATPPADFRSIDLALWSVPASGGTPVQLTSPALHAGGDEDPVSRPGHDQEAFIRWAVLAANYQPYSQLALRDNATGSVYLLTAGNGGRVIQPAWSPGGGRIVFVRRTNGVDEIAVAPLKASATGYVLGSRTVIARGDVGQPAFTPDGKHVTYLRVTGDTFEIDIAPAGGGAEKKLPFVSPGFDSRWQPSWHR